MTAICGNGVTLAILLVVQFSPLGQGHPFLLLTAWLQNITSVSNCLQQVAGRILPMFSSALTLMILFINKIFKKG